MDPVRGGLPRSNMLVAIDLSVRHGMKTGDWGGGGNCHVSASIDEETAAAKRRDMTLVDVSSAAAQKGFSAMNFRTLAASVGPRGRLLAFLAATALAVSFAMTAQAQTPAPAPGAPAPGQEEGRSESTGCCASARRSGAGAGPAAGPARATGPGAAGTGWPAAAGSGSADLRALDQVLPQGTGRQRQAGLLHRQGRPHRVRPAGGRRRHHRAGR